MTEKNIAVLPGDGIGPEIMDEAVRLLELIGEKYEHRFHFHYADVGGAAWEKHHSHLPASTLEICANADAILSGSVGGHVNLQHTQKWSGVEVNSLLGLRKHFGLYANLRPARLYTALASSSPLRADIAKKGFDILVVRELTGGIYFGEPKGRSGKGGEEFAFDTMLYKRDEIRRIADLAFRIAGTRKGKVTSIDKANVLKTMVFWREVVEEVRENYPDIDYEPMYVDNAAQQLLLDPSQFDVLLCGNMFGDILSDEAAALSGSLGMLPSASLAEEGFGMYEPGGRSAPDIAGKGIANPIAQIMSAAMMLKYSFGMPDAYDTVSAAVENVLNRGYPYTGYCRSRYQDPGH
ncbi:MAG: 3-isopropylmalate dehydrogenase [Candidatus Marinimicrobia bacterium]|nr:3-isopropylmalate dehydrogenase [Candidatus Neomarinimicrobiota bacterium]